METTRLWFAKEDRGQQLFGPFDTEEDAREFADKNPEYYGYRFGRGTEVVCWCPTLALKD